MRRTIKQRNRGLEPAVRKAASQFCRELRKELVALAGRADRRWPEKLPRHLDLLCDCSEPWCVQSTAKHHCRVPRSLDRYSYWQRRGGRENVYSWQSVTITFAGDPPMVLTPVSIQYSSPADRDIKLSPHPSLEASYASCPEGSTSSR